MLRNFLPAWLAPADASHHDAGTSTSTSNPKDARDISIEDSNTTPKANPTQVRLEVPDLTLEEDEGENSEVETPSFPAQHSAQRAYVKPPSPDRNLASGRIQPSSASLMPPPSRPRLPATNSLRVPSNGPLPNRGPPVGSQQRISNSLSPNAAVKPSSKGRGKVILKPGHSPMDWAALTHRGNISGVSKFERVTPSKLKTMTGRRGKPAWSSWGGKVYNITPYLPFHPGGEAELMKAAGRDGTKLFMDVHPWVNWESMLGACLVGVMVPEDFADNESSLEAMD